MGDNVFKGDDLEGDVFMRCVFVGDNFTGDIIEFSSDRTVADLTGDCCCNITASLV